MHGFCRRDAGSTLRTASLASTEQSVFTSSMPHHKSNSPRLPSSRRAFLQSATLAGLGSLMGTQEFRAGAETGRDPSKEPASPATDSDVGSLFPFINSQAVKGEFPLSFLNRRFRSVSSWKKTARGKLLELLQYSPPTCDPRAETVERVDCGEYVRERVWFNTTPDLRVPAFVLVPKSARRPMPAIVALHDHGGFYFWGKEKIVEMPEEHPVLTEFKRNYYGGRSIANELVKQGYLVVIIDMFYWGERRMILDADT
jgi:hypothetical protein